MAEGFTRRGRVVCLDPEDWRVVALFGSWVQFMPMAILINPKDWK